MVRHQRRALWLCLGLAALLAASGLAEGAGDFSYAILADGTAEITGWSGEDAALEVPAALDGHRVSAIGAGAFAGNARVEAITLPDGVETLGDGAFADCYSLDEIHIPATVQQVGENPFAGCESLRLLDLADGQPYLQMINGVLFGDGGGRLILCPRLLPMERYTLPEGVRTIDARAFSYCNRLLSVTLPDSVADIGAEAFEGRANLTLVVGRGSYSERYAMENEIKFTYPDAAEWLAD